MKDYRLSHLGERKTTQYDEVIYRQNSYDDWLWRYERAILASEIKCIEEGRRTRYLDFATGTGRIIAFLEDSFKESVGVDMSSDMLVRAKEKTKKAKFIEADITVEDSLAGEEFDVITAFRFFLNAQPVLRDAALKVLVPKLREDGIFIFNIHGNAFNYRIFAKLWYRMRGRQLNTMTVFAAHTLARRHGLSVERWYGFGLIPKVFYRLFGGDTMFALDQFLCKIPGMKFFGYDLVFVCKKDDANYS
ncbi:MAG: class I SAM-dependent methyltransferase [Patescibacteria group bacterium]